MELKKYGERKAKHSNSVAFEEQIKFGGGNVMVWELMTWNGT